MTNSDWIKANAFLGKKMSNAGIEQRLMKCVKDSSDMC